MAGDNLVVSGIRLDSKDLARGVSQAEQYIRRLERRVNELEKEAKQASTAFGDMAKKIGAMVAALGGMIVIRQVTKDIIETNRTFQSLEMQLRTVTGSVMQAEQAFNILTEFGATTPFQLRDVTDAFVQLAAFGIKPTVEQMRGMGNMATAFQRDITSMTGAIISAANGMIRPLRAFGVQSQIQGDRAKVTFRGVTYEIDRSVAAFTELIAQFGNTQFVDAMSNQMLTLNGIMSNLEDQTDLLKNKIGKAGLNMELFELYQLVQDTVAEGDEFARIVGQSMGGSVSLLTKALALLIKHIDVVVIALQAMTSAAVMRGMVALVSKMGALTMTGVGLKTVMMALGGPAGVILTLAAAIAGPMVLAMITAKSRAQELADQLNAVRQAAMSIKSTDLEAALAETLAGIAGMEARKPGLKAVAGTPEKRAMLAPEMGTDLRTYTNLQERARILEQLLATYTQDLADANKARISEAYISLLQKMDDEIVKLQQGERAMLAQQLARQGMTEAQQADILARHDTLTAIEAEKKALEDAATAERERQETIDQMIGALEDEEAALKNTRAELILQRMVVEGATEAERGRAFWLLRNIDLLQQKQLAAAKARAAEEREFQKQMAEYEAEQAMVKATADRMAEAFADASIATIANFNSIDEAFHDLMESIANEILRLSFRKLITEPLTNIILGALGMGGLGPGTAPTPTTGNYTGTVGPNIQMNPSSVAVPVIVPVTVSSDGGGSPMTVQQNITFRIMAIDSRSTAQWVNENKGLIAAAAADGVRQSMTMQRELLRR